MLTELRLPTIGRLWSEFAERSDKEGWPASRFLGGLLEHELAERATRRTERHRAESQLDATKTLASFDFAEVPMLSKAHVDGACQWRRLARQGRHGADLRSARVRDMMLTSPRH